MSTTNTQCNNVMQISCQSVHQHLLSYSDGNVWWPWLRGGQPKHGANLCGCRAVLSKKIHRGRLQQHWCVPSGVLDSGASSRTQQRFTWYYWKHPGASHHHTHHWASSCGCGLVVGWFGFILGKHSFLLFFLYCVTNLTV